jgi:hypothetical protein
MPISKPFADKDFREFIEKQVYENEHLLYDIVREKFYILLHEKG